MRLAIAVKFLYPSLPDLCTMKAAPKAEQNRLETGRSGLSGLVWWVLRCTPAREVPVNGSRNTDPAAAAAAELKKHLPELIRWGVICLMVLFSLLALTMEGEGDMHFAGSLVLIGLWMISLMKTGHSAFMVVAAWLDQRSDSEAD